jgi:tetratricopeptide (TPR) repeat protein
LKYLSKVITLVLAVFLSTVTAQATAQVTAQVTAPTGTSAMPERITTGSSSLQGEAREALARAEGVAQEALRLYERHNVDFALWRQAIAAGQRAQRLAPDEPAPLRFLAEAYSVTLFYARAWDLWQRYEAAGGHLDEDAQAMLAVSGSQLAYSRYAAGDLDGALDLYLRVIGYAPDNLEAHVWAGRILLELGQPDSAAHYWEEVLRLDPSDARAEYFLALARDQARWGVAATTAFYEGVRLYEAGDLRQAQLQFARAGESNRGFTEAWAWLGRSYFEQGSYRDALTYYRRAANLAPDNETYRYFAQESERRMRE